MKLLELLQKVEGQYSLRTYVDEPSLYEIVVTSAVVCLVAVSLLCGCNTSDAPVPKPLPKVREVMCQECAGSGVVRYSHDHVLVTLRQAEPNREYRCPMCGGSGKLYEDV